MKNACAAVAFILACVTFLPPLAGWWVREEIQHRMKIKIGGTFSPIFFRYAFSLQDASFELTEKVKLVSGRLQVAYEPLSLVGNRPLRIRLSGRDVRARLLGGWARAQGVEEIRLKHFEADIGVGREGLEEIYAVEATSPTFQFHLKKSER